MSKGPVWWYVISETDGVSIDVVDGGVEVEHKMLAAEGGFGDPVCPACHSPARLVESKVVTVPVEWRDFMRFGDAVECDHCGHVANSRVPYISLAVILRNNEALLREAILAAGAVLAQRLRELDILEGIK